MTFIYHMDIIYNPLPHGTLTQEKKLRRGSQTKAFS
jgi:hypothetical protein